MKRILIRPSQWSFDRLQNRLFSEGTSFQALYSAGLRRWRAQALEAGYSLDTWDVHPLDSADVIWFLDLPAHRRDVLAARRAAPGALMVLQILESPVLGPHFFHARNHRDFDVVLTYDGSLCDERRYFQYRLPHEPVPVESAIPYGGRKVCCMINSNRLEGYFAPRQLGPEGLPVIGRWLGGWKLGLTGLLRPAGGELYSERRRLARTEDRLGLGALTVYGPNWNGEPISWFPLYPNAPYRCRAGGVVQHSKFSIMGQYRFSIAYENFEGSRGYISEKIFDSLAAGTVPVYRGDAGIHDYVPREAMVRADDFRNEEELLRYLQACPEAEWLRMREAGRRFMDSDAFQPFTSEAFADRMMDVLSKTVAARA